MDEELQLAWEMIDLDGNGIIGTTEVLRSLSLSGVDDATDAEVAEMIRLCDPNGNGFVEFHEFFSAFKHPPPLFRNFDLQRKNIESPSEAQPGSGVPSLPGQRPASSEDASESVSNVTAGPPSRPASQQRPHDNRPEAIATIMGRRALKPQFIRQLYQRFVEIDTNDNGLISYDAFCLVLRRAQGPAMRRAFEIFDVDQTTELDLRNFVVSLSMFTKSRTEDKLRFAFMMFDEEQRGSLSRADLGEMLKAIDPTVSPQARDSHVSRFYAANNMHPNARGGFNEIALYIMDNEDELVPATGGDSGRADTSGAEA